MKREKKRRNKRAVEVSTCTFASVDRFQQSIHNSFVVLCVYFLFSYAFYSSISGISLLLYWLGQFNSWEHLNRRILFACCLLSFFPNFDAIDHRRLWQFAQYFLRVWIPFYFLRMNSSPAACGSIVFKGRSSAVLAKLSNNNHIATDMLQLVRIFSHSLTSTLSKWAVKYIDDFRFFAMQWCRWNVHWGNKMISLSRSICYGLRFFVTIL